MRSVGTTVVLVVVLMMMVTGSEATCGHCNERLKVSLLCCLIEGTCCVLGPIAVGKRDVSWALEHSSQPQLPRIHPLARPR